MSAAAFTLTAPTTKILPFGAKAARFIRRRPEEDRFVNILEGSIRSAKTWTMLAKILVHLCTYPVAGHKVFFGVSKQTIYNNVLSDIFDLLNEDEYNYNRNSGEVIICGSKWLTIGAKDEGSEKYVRGLTVGIGVGDELTLLPESFLNMIRNRMSPLGARFYGTTNPDNPYHHVKTNLIDNPGLRKLNQIFCEHFTLDDNPNLTEEYKQNVVAGYTGMYKLRYVDGLWVAAEGSIYKDCWNEDKYAYDDATAPKNLRRPGGYADHGISSDYGTDNPQVYLDIFDDGTTLWVDREYYWDSKVTGRQKTDAQYGDDLEEFMGPKSDAQFIVPPEASSFEAELQQRGVWMTTADNEVLEGIKAVSQMMSRGLIRIHKRCVNLLKELPAYCWNPKRSDKGIEEPIKKNDHACDALRYYVKTKIPAWRLTFGANGLAA